MHYFIQNILVGIFTPMKKKKMQNAWDKYLHAEEDIFAYDWLKFIGFVPIK